MKGYMLLNEAEDVNEYQSKMESATEDGNDSVSVEFFKNPLDTLTEGIPSESKFIRLEAESAKKLLNVPPCETYNEDSHNYGLAKLSLRRKTSNFKFGAEAKLVNVISEGATYVLDKSLKKRKKNKSTSFYATNESYKKSSTSENFSNSATLGIYSNSVTSGDFSHSVTTGEGSMSATVGDDSISATKGYGAHAISAGESSHAITVGDDSFSASVGAWTESYTQGNYAHATALGGKSNSKTLGMGSNSATLNECSDSETRGKLSNSAVLGENSCSCTYGSGANSASLGKASKSIVNHKNSVSAALGAESSAQGIKGSWLVLTEWKEEANGEYTIIGVKTIQVDGEIIKEHKEYALINGIIREHEDKDTEDSNS